MTIAGNTFENNWEGGQPGFAIVFTGAPASNYPVNNSFPSAAQSEAQFVSFSSGDYRLVETSPWNGARTDGLDLGASVGAVR